jgi:CHAD domain-containing protein
MARKGKWIEGITPEQPVSAAARIAIQRRLAVLWHYLPLAARQAQQDVEYVHQLRVASRRAVIALETFHDVLPPRRARWLLKQLKKVRRAAGEARDDDVLAERLEQWTRKRPAVAIVLKQVRRHRRQAQAPIEQIYHKLVRKQFPRRVAHLLQRIRWRDKPNPEPCFASAAHHGLSPLLEQFEICSNADFSDIESLHQFRIAGKRLRYAMELFATAFAPEFRRQLYPETEQLQGLLGAVNDHAVACARLEAWIAENQDEELNVALRKLAAAERAALKRSRARFLEFWTPDRAASIREQFAHHLSASPHGC